MNHQENCRDSRIKITSTVFECVRATANSVGYDLRCAHDFDIHDGDITIVGTGVFVDMPADTYAMVCSRSGLSTNGIIVANAPGIIDPDYKQEIKVILHKLANGPHSIKFTKGDKIAQLMFAKTVIADDIAKGERIGGLGSTGM